MSVRRSLYTHIVHQLEGVFVVAETAVYAGADQHDPRPVHGEADGVRAPVAGVPGAVLVHPDEAGRRDEVLHRVRVHLLLRRHSTTRRERMNSDD